MILPVLFVCANNPEQPEKIQMTSAKPDGHTTLENPFQAPPHRTADRKHKERCLILHRMDHDVIEVVENLPEVYYFDEQGRHRRFQFDFISVAKNGRRTAIAALLEDEAGPARAALPLVEQWQEKIKDIDANAFAIITDLNLDEDQVRNADLIGWAGGDNEVADQAMRATIARNEGPATIAEIQTASGLGGEGFRAPKAIIATVLRSSELINICPICLQHEQTSHLLQAFRRHPPGARPSM